MFLKIKRRICILINRIKFAKSNRKLKNLRNAYNGKRCFIVGNGPSLRAEDLEKMKDEYCFGTHRIYKIFGETSWRPNFYCAQDFNLINDSICEIDNMRVDNKFIAFDIKTLIKKNIKNSINVKLLTKEFYPEKPQFSNDAICGIYEGYTVTYMCIQLAVYLGFKEIILLGIDHNYSSVLLPNGTKLIDEKIKDHFSDDDKITNIPQIYKSTLAYEAARSYAVKNQITIYNATRGGNLEVFKRINFDDVIANNK